MKRILIGSRRAARAFSTDEPYAVISMVGTYLGTPRSAPRILRPPSLRGRIVIACDDVLVDAEPGSAVPFRAMTEEQALRVARFVEAVAADIDTLFVHCLAGHSRSAGAGKAIAEAYGVPVSNVRDGEEFAPNEHVYALMRDALARAEKKRARE
jgi:predicted protein tyrosine phosphatase